VASRAVVVVSREPIAMVVVVRRAPLPVVVRFVALPLTRTWGAIVDLDRVVAVTATNSRWS
jgi:hypothetical protein